MKGRPGISLALTMLVAALAFAGCNRTDADSTGENEMNTNPGQRLPEPRVDTTTEEAAGERQAVFAGGCFWCVEAVFEQLQGVSEVVSGYAGGSKDTADYRTVSAGRTDHAEVVRVTYDPSRITYGELLRVFFATHDPTQLNRQGPDVGKQYRSAIFYEPEEQKKVAEAYIRQLEEAGAFDKPIVTTLEKLDAFYDAEDYHQDYVKQNPFQPYVQAHALPKLQKVKEKFPEKLKSEE